MTDDEVNATEPDSGDGDVYAVDLSREDDRGGEVRASEAPGESPSASASASLSEESRHDADGGDPAEDEPLAVSVPEEHVGPFVAEAFEDAERDTAWTDVVDSMVGDDALSAWRDLTPAEQAVEVLEMADDYDRRAVENLESIPLTGGELDPADEQTIADALRCRRNADILRDGVAAAYDDGHLDDDALVAAVESFGFDTERVAAREDALEAVAERYEIDFRPYGGTLFSEEDDPEGVPEDEEVW
jgi:hypothetical protein